MCVFNVKPFPPRILSNEPHTPLLPGSGVSDAHRQSWFDQMEREALRCPSAVVALSEVDRKTLKALATRELDVEVGLGHAPPWDPCQRY